MICAQASCTVEYSFFCRSCGDKASAKLSIQRGDQFPDPGIPIGWSLVDYPNGLKVLICGKHLVELRIDCEVITE